MNKLTSRVLIIVLMALMCLSFYRCEKIDDCLGVYERIENNRAAALLMCDGRPSNYPELEIVLDVLKNDDCDTFIDSIRTRNYFVCNNVKVTEKVIVYLKY
jgi:hypothetical protein